MQTGKLGDQRAFGRPWGSSGAHDDVSSGFQIVDRDTAAAPGCRDLRQQRLQQRQERLHGRMQNHAAGDAGDVRTAGAMQAE